MSRDPFAEYDAAYVLGALSPTDREAYEEHLRTCADCARAVREVAGLPGLLSRVPASDLGPPPALPPLPETLLPGLLGRVRREQRRRRVWTGSAAAAVVAVVAVGSAVVTSNLEQQDDGPVAAPPVSSPSTAGMAQMAPVAQSTVTGWLGMEQVPWGTRLTVTCTYAGGDHRDDERYGGGEGKASYLLVVRTRSGQEETVASWVAVPGKTMTVTGATASSRDDIASVEIRLRDGRPILRHTG